MYFFRDIDYFVYFSYYVHNMNTTTVNATDLKKNISEILNMVYYEKRVAIVERHGKPLVKIVPIIKEAHLDDYFGALPDFPKVGKRGVKRIKRKINPAFELLKLAKEAEEIDRKYGKSTGPADWSINHDYYLYGAPKKKP